MPIKYSEYHPEWKKVIRPAILQRAENKCEECGLENGAIGWRDINGDFCYTEAYLKVKKLGYGFYQTSGYLKIVLTIAHLDHDKNNNDHSNLKALCQKCHLAYDKELHLKNSRETRNKKKGLIELPFNNQKTDL